MIEIATFERLLTRPALFRAPILTRTLTHTRGKFTGQALRPTPTATVRMKIPRIAKNKSFAVNAEASAIPLKPTTAARIAIKINIRAYFSIFLILSRPAFSRQRECKY